MIVQAHTAHVARRIVHVRHATGTFHTEAFPPEARELGPMGTALNEFIDTPMPTSDFWSTTQKGEPRAGHGGNGGNGLQMMPYTEENAAFFVRTMTRLCEMAEAMDRFMGDGPDDLARSIAAGTSTAIAAID